MSENRGPGAPSDGAPTGNTPSELRDLIAETLKEQTKEPAAPAAGDGEQSGTDELARAGQPPAEGGESPKREPPERGPDGRFLPSGEDAAKSGAPGEQRQPPAEGGEPPPAAADKAPIGPPKAPDHWSADDKELFGSLSSDADRDKFLKLNARREAGLTPRLQRAADLERASAQFGGYGEIEQLFQPWQEQLRAQQRTPKDVVKTWYQVERGLTDKATQDEVIANIIVGYGASPVNIARHLNARRGFADQGGSDGGRGQPNGGYQPNGGQPAPVQGGQTAVADPALAARLERLEVGYHNLSAGEQARFDAEQRRLADETAHAYRTFADARDAAGNLLHPHLAEVESQMTFIAKLDREQGKTTVDLQDLYDRATWQNNSTRERLLAQHQEDEARKAADERKAKAEAARRASSSVTGAPGPGQAPQDLGAPDRSIRDEIRAQMDGGGRR